MSYYGDIRLNETIDLKFSTRSFTTGAPTTLAGTPVISAYPGNSVTQLTAGITLSVDFDAVTGLHNVRVVATGVNGYATATNYALVITTGTVGGVSVVGEVVGTFSIEARSALMPTTAARTLDVSAGGEAGMDWANVGNPATTVGLSGTTVSAVTTVATATNVTTVNGLAANVITAASAAADFGTEIAAAVWDRDATLSQTQGTFGQAMGDPVLDTDTLWGLANTNLDAAISTRATPAQVNTEVVDALNIDTYAEPGQGIPAATTTLAAKLNYLYKGWRNRRTQTATTFRLYNDDAITVDQQATVSDDATTFDRTEITTGP